MKALVLDELRSLLFVPADSQRFVAGAARRGADAVILDLEDGISDRMKASARSMLAESVRVIREGKRPILVRVNHLPELVDADVCAAIAAGADGIVLPKVESSADMGDFDHLVRGHAKAQGRSSDMPIVAVIETPQGVCNAHAIANASSQLKALCFGPEDYSNAMGIEPQVDALAWPAQAVANASVAAGLTPLGLSFSVSDFTDLVEFRRLVAHARRIGMRGAPCIHPSQIEVLNEVFGGTEDEARVAQSIVAAFDQAASRGIGSIAVAGRMVDRPVAERARRFLERWRRHQLPRDVSIEGVSQ